MDGSLAHAAAHGDAADWLTRKEASKLLGNLGCPLSPSMLARMAMHNNQGRGPPFWRSGERTIRYHVADLRQWAAARVRRVV